jgi:hypothetical protein
MLSALLMAFLAGLPFEETFDYRNRDDQSKKEYLLRNMLVKLQKQC